MNQTETPKAVDTHHCIRYNVRVTVNPEEKLYCTEEIWWSSVFHLRIRCFFFKRLIIGDKKEILEREVSSETLEKCVRFMALLCLRRNVWEAEWKLENSLISQTKWFWLFLRPNVDVNAAASFEIWALLSWARLCDLGGHWGRRWTWFAFPLF